MQRGARLHQRRIMRVRTLSSVLERRGLTTSHVAADRAADLLEVKLGSAVVSCLGALEKLYMMREMRAAVTILTTSLLRLQPRRAWQRRAVVVTVARSSSPFRRWRVARPRTTWRHLAPACRSRTPGVSSIYGILTKLSSASTSTSSPRGLSRRVRLRTISA